MHRVSVGWRTFAVVQVAGIAGSWFVQYDSPWVFVWIFVMLPGSLILPLLHPRFDAYFDHLEPGWQRIAVFMLIVTAVNLVAWFAVFRTFRMLRSALGLTRR